MKPRHAACAALILALLLPAAPASLPAAEAGKDRVLRLFNGKDLSNFYTWLKGHGKEKDPDKVFTVKDGMIRVSGQTWGCFTTQKEYENYHLIVEYKWGEKTWAPRADRARDSGILLHCAGEDGVVGGAWMESIECQIIEGGTGDFILVGGKGRPRLTVEAEARPTGAGEKKREEFYYRPGAPAREFRGGRINWFGRDPAWRDVKGFRGQQDLERPVGQWNRLECICDGDRITNILNGRVVNAGTRASHTKGKILFQSEGAEIFFRRIDLKPLKK